MKNTKKNKSTQKTTKQTPAVGALIMKFMTKRGTGKEFSGTQLRDYVSKTIETAPSTVDRTLRQLRQDGKVDYEVTNRRESRYQIKSV